MEKASDPHLKIVVIMSTYNGAAFVEEQLRSILDQLPPTAQVLIRDDGSSDNTVSCIRAIADARITLWTGPNLGFVRSFFALMHAVPLDADIIMFSDQDDIWLPEKVRRTCSALQGRDVRPTLYASRYRVVGAELQPICSSTNFRKEPSFANAVCENIVAGCTMALNQSGLKLVRSGGNLARIVSHDWWAYLVITALGDLVFDRVETILYRQHASNSIGMHQGLKSQIRRLKILANSACVINRHVTNLIETHGAYLGDEKARIIRQYFDFKRAASVFRFIFSMERFRLAPQDDLALRCAVAFTWLFRRRDLKDLTFPMERV